MKRLILSILSIWLITGCERTTRNVIIIQPQPEVCESAQTIVDTYSRGNLLIPAGCAVLISRTLRIREGTLKIEEGATLYFEFGGEIIIENDGTINVSGTLQNPVIFTSAYDPPLSGDWTGITIYSTGNNIISNAIIEYATKGISLYGDVYISDTDFYYNFYGFKTDGKNAYFELMNVSFSGSEYASLYLYSHTLTLLSESIYLDSNDVIYVDGSDGVINSGIWPGYTYVFLTNVVINRGADIYVSDADIYVKPPYEIIVNGRLRASNTNFLSNSSSTCWGGISFEGADPTSYLHSCSIKDAGAGVYKANIAIIDTYGENLEIVNSEISYGCGDGVYILNSDVSIINSEIHHNYYYGVYVDCGGYFEDINNIYYSNGWGNIATNPNCP